MKKHSNENHADHALLARFCNAVMETVQTPELINRVAADAGFVRLCRQVTASAETSCDDAFTAFCNRFGYNATRIRLRLQPVARALRLDAHPADAGVDYYALLGVAADADAQTIKRAFRERALLLHPDHRPGDDGKDFIALQTAYVHLSDAELRSRCDRAVQRGEKWFESAAPDRPVPPPRGYSPLIWLVGAIAAILVAAAFGFDFYVQQSAMSAPNAAQERLQTDGAQRAAGQGSTTAKMPDGYRRTAMVEPVAVGQVHDAQSGSDINAWYLSVEPAAGVSDTSAPATPPVETPLQTEQAEMREVLERLEDSDGTGGGTQAVDATQQASVARETVAKGAVAKASVVKESVVKDAVAKASIAKESVLKKAVAKDTVIKKAVAPKTAAQNSNRRALKDPPGTAAVENAPPKIAHPDNRKTLEEASAQSQALASALAASAAAHASKAAAGPAAMPPPTESPELGLQERLHAFLEAYCSAYTNEDLEAFSAFFTPDATEQGKPFTSMLPQYQQTFNLIETMDYHIRLVSFTQPAGSASHPAPIDLQGEFAVTYTLTDGREGRSSGSISLGLIDTGEKLRVKTLAYTQ